MYFENAVEKIIGGQNLRGNTTIDITPVIQKLKELETLARKYQTGTPAVIDFSPLIAKLKDAEKIGHDLQAKAKSLSYIKKR